MSVSSGRYLYCSFGVVSAFAFKSPFALAFASDWRYDGFLFSTDLTFHFISIHFVSIHLVLAGLVRGPDGPIVTPHKPSSDAPDASHQHCHKMPLIDNNMPGNPLLRSPV